jgi:methylmalonyl-CoA mutase
MTPIHLILAAWGALVEKQSKGLKPDDFTWHTPEGIPLKTLYTAEDLEGCRIPIRYPGCRPTFRGPQATMYAGRRWTIRQYAGFSTAEASNAFYRKSLAAGGQGISVAFDLATHRGYDSDHPRVAAMLAKPAWRRFRRGHEGPFDGIPLDQVSVSMTMNGAVLPVLAGYIVAAEEQGVDPRHAVGHHSERHPQRIHGAQYLYLPAWPSMRIIGDIIAYCSANLPRSIPFRSLATTCRRLGRMRRWSSPIRLPMAKEYIQTALAAGLKIDDFAPRLSVFSGALA